MKKTVILISTFIIIIGLFFLTIKGGVECFNIASASNINNCINQQVRVNGKLECTIESSKIPGIINFNDKSKLQILDVFANCKEYNGKNVEIIGQLHKCEGSVSCVGIGVTEIKSLVLIE